MHAASYCAELLRRAGAAIEWRACSAVGRLARVGHAWVAYDRQEREIARAPVAIIAAGLELGTLAGISDDSQLLPLQRMRGQLTGVPVAACHAPRTVVSGDGYCLPAVRGMLWTGATYGPGDSDSSPREQDHAQNLARLSRMLPDNTFAAMPAGLGAHVGFRAVAPDRLPLVGALPDIAAIASSGTKRPSPALTELPRLPGLYASGAMASRGLTWAALSGEVLAALIEGEAPPVEADLLDAIDPARFVERRLRRGQFNPGE
jgi:tRNA 5-methylaminomethyl-2-thiouridine biosynthesis bifunctional protein